MMNTTDTDLEKEVAELARIEKLKGPRNPGPAQQYFQPAALTEQQLQAAAAERDRLEALKRPRALPPKPEIDFAQQTRERLERERLHERLKGL